mmetsp:Transcript_14401/g.36192  ORF Transcript_14401/g.36192 Transcript_14401/m.36192 type:complete len:180 (+) Transcript_14401:250-789(+)
MNQPYRNKQYRNLSRQAEDASVDGIMSTKTISGRQSLVASVVKAASSFNNLLIENCGICTTYCDKQVQYEDYVQQQYDVSTGAMGHLYSQLNPTVANSATASVPRNTVIEVPAVESRNNSDFVNPTNETSTPPNNTMKSPTRGTDDQRIEVERYYREFLFDEDSVVRSVGSRGAADDEE